MPIPDYSIGDRYSGAPIDWDSVVLDTIKVRCTQVVGPEFMERVKVETWREPMLDGLAISLCAEVLGERLGTREHHIYRTRTAFFATPKSPWQFFKRRHKESWWLGWFVRRWPEEYVTETRAVEFRETITFEDMVLFPSSPLKTPPHIQGRHVIPYTVMVDSG